MTTTHVQRPSAFPRRYVLPGLLALACLLLAATGVRADATYCYQGPAFDNISQQPAGTYVAGDHISGCMTLAAPLGANQAVSIVDNSDVVSANFTDGFINLATAPDTFINGLAFGTTNGQITSWFLTLENLPVTEEIFSEHILTDPANPQFVGLEDEDLTFDSPGGNIITDPQASCVCDASGVWTTKSITNPMPEPNSLALLVLGLSLVGVAAPFAAGQRPKHDTI